MAVEAARFAERIRKHFGLPVELVDERLSSWEAAQVVAERGLRGNGSREKRCRRPLDEVAAAVILRDYLARAGTPASRSEQRPGAGVAQAARHERSQAATLVLPASLSGARSGRGSRRGSGRRSGRG
jgi:hypothetical protein